MPGGRGKHIIRAAERARQESMRPARSELDQEIVQDLIGRKEKLASQLSRINEVLEKGAEVVTETPVDQERLRRFKSALDELNDTLFVLIDAINAYRRQRKLMEKKGVREMLAVVDEIKDVINNSNIDLGMLRLLQEEHGEQDEINMAPGAHLDPENDNNLKVEATLLEAYLGRLIKTSSILLLMAGTSGRAVTFGTARGKGTKRNLPN